MKRSLWRIVPLIAFSILIIVLARGLWLEPHTLPSTQIGRPLPPFSLPILQAQTAQTAFNPALLTGHVALLNVWASWCAACQEEQVFLLGLARQGIAIYGLNYKDSPADAVQWLKEWGNPYEAIGSDIDGRVAIDLGIYGAPETFLLDRHGYIHYRHVGVLTEQVWQHEFMPRIAQLEAENNA